MNLRNLLFIAILCGCHQLLGQEANPDSNRIMLYHKWENGQLLLRWNPAHPALWEHGTKVGYIIEKYLYPEQAGGELELLSRSEPFYPKTYEDWGPPIANIQQEIVGGIRDFVHFDRVSPELIEEDLPSSLYSGYDRLNLRYQLSNYLMHQHFELVKRSGLGIADTTVNSNRKYRYQIRFAQPYEAATIPPATLVFSARSYQDPTVPPLEAEFKTRFVKLKWRTKEFRDVYFGYLLEKSENGIDFKPVNEEPAVNLYDTALVEEAFKYIYLRDSLDENNKAYTYRLRGADYFGGKSKRYSDITGMGYDEIPYSPILKEVLQTDSNYAVLRWHFPPEYEKQLKEFQVFRGDSMEGIFSPVQIGIDKQARTTSLFMTGTANYYRIVAVPINGPNKGSFPSLVMSWDSDPPAVPRGLVGTIDSNGIVQLHWDENTEEDLDGYKIYKSYVEDAEFAGITPGPIQLTSFTDTVSMTLGNEKVFYQLQAVDKRNNRSAFTEILTLKKVDVYPPVEPHIYEVTKGKDQIELKWHNSSSADVVRHRLFRRAMKEEQSWTLLADFALGEEPDTYIDSTLEQGKLYVYTLTAIDDDGLESAPAQPASAKLVGPPRQSFEKIEAEIIDEKSLKITWLYPEQAQKYWIYKGTEDQQLTLFKVLKADKDFVVDAKLKPGGTYHYYLRAVLEDGSFSPFSKKIEVSIPAD
mgnify:CR=1 FL=1